MLKEKDNLKRLYTDWFHLFNILENNKIIVVQKRFIVLQSWEQRGEKATFKQ